MRRAKRTEDPRILTHIAPVELGMIDLLVQEGFYRTRAHFFRSAVNDKLRFMDVHVKAAAQRGGFQIGRMSVAEDCPPVVRVVGVATVSPLAVPRLEELTVFGVVEAEDEVIAALGDRLITRAFAIPITWEPD